MQIKLRAFLRATSRYHRPALIAALTTALLLPAFMLASTTVGRQDIAGLFALQPGVTERARAAIYAGPLQNPKTASLGWPSAHHPTLTSEAPTRAALAADVNRFSKSDRLSAITLAPQRLPDGEAGELTLDSATGTGISTGGTATTVSGLSTGTGISPIDAGIGTDPAEADDAADAIDTPTLANDGVYAISAGDPTGDPAELEAEIAAQTITLGTDETGDLVDIDEDGNAVPSDIASMSVSTQTPIYRESALIFTLNADALPPQPFLHLDAPLANGGTSLTEKSDPDAETPRLALNGPSPAERLGLEGKRYDRSLKCLAEAIYFESRGEPERGQVAVAQVVMNRVFSGYYPADICRAVYQNANRKLACQFTFACDNIRDVVTEPRLWKQAQRIATDMLEGAIWDDKVGRATHYHAQSVRPNWIREMRKLDRIGEHTFYRPRRWTS